MASSCNDGLADRLHRARVKTVKAATSSAIVAAKALGNPHQPLRGTGPRVAIDIPCKRAYLLGTIFNIRVAEGEVISILIKTV